MFTGIAEETGRLIRSRDTGGGKTLEFAADRILEDLKVEDSVSVNGVCLTVSNLFPGGFKATAVLETLKKTGIGQLQNGSSVNLERALSANGRFGGHIVQGHVDCLGRISSIVDANPGKEYLIDYPAEFARYTPTTASVSVDGISLTIAEFAGLSDSNAKLRIALIPYTLKNTTLGKLKSGSLVNLEFDCLAKYLEQLQLFGKDKIADQSRNQDSKLSIQRMRELGF
jgi:riboflavin synthase